MKMMTMKAKKKKEKGRNKTEFDTLSLILTCIISIYP